MPLDRKVHSEQRFVIDQLMLGRHSQAAVKLLPRRKPALQSLSARRAKSNYPSLSDESSDQGRLRIHAGQSLPRWRVLEQPSSARGQFTLIGNNGIETKSTQVLLSAERPFDEESRWGATFAYTFSDADPVR